VSGVSVWQRMGQKRKRSTASCRGKRGGGKRREKGGKKANEKERQEKQKMCEHGEKTHARKKVDEPYPHNGRKQCRERRSEEKEGEATTGKEQWGFKRR